MNPDNAGSSGVSFCPLSLVERESHLNFVDHEALRYDEMGPRGLNDDIHDENAIWARVPESFHPLSPLQPGLASVALKDKAAAGPPARLFDISSLS